MEVFIFWICPYFHLCVDDIGGSGVCNICSRRKNTTLEESPPSDSRSSREKNGGEGRCEKATLQESEEAEVQKSKTQGGEGRCEKQATKTSMEKAQQQKEVSDKNKRGYLMALGILAASVTYQTGLKPPGGLWQDNSGGHSAGSSILHHIDKRRYHAFFYCNSISFMASVVVVILLLPWTLHGYPLPLSTMQTAIWFNMLGLLGAYAAGSTRDWETSRNVIYLVIPILAYIAVCAAVSMIRKSKSQGHKSSGNDEDQP